MTRSDAEFGRMVLPGTIGLILRRGLVAAAITLSAAWGQNAYAAPSITLSAASGPPTTSVAVSGSGFAPGEHVAIFFGTKHEATATADGSGNLPSTEVRIPAAAKPGRHWISAVDRATQICVHEPFLVNTNWAEFGFVPEGGRNNIYENVLDRKNVASLDTLWVATTGSVVGSSPAVANGVVYVGSEDGRVYAFNAATGSTLWTATTGSAVDSSPAVANGVVYFGSYDHNVYAFDAATGSTLWTATTGNLVISSPAVANGVVYVGSYDGKLYALNAATGSTLWTATTDRGIGHSSPAVANGVVYVGSGDGKVYAFDAATGSTLWTTTTGNVVGSSPAVANGVVYVGSSDNNLYAFSINGLPLASTRAKAAPLMSTLVPDRTLSPVN